ncbi:hypothetical protein KY321_02220, partial [Candidatus Woesearchaeota archaeon]|nr:hypothetical protein [Candidatus Woesearchaeota archaeon]
MNNLEDRLNNAISWREGDGLYPYYMMESENKNFTDVLYLFGAFPNLKGINLEYNRMISTIKKNIANLIRETDDPEDEYFNFYCNAEELECIILSEELGDDLASVSKKLLKIELLKDVYSIIDFNLDPKTKSTIVKSQLRDVEQKLNEIKDFGSINPFNLLSAKKLKISPYKQLCVGSMSKLFSCITESCGIPVYEKYKIFSYLNGKVSTPNSDLGIKYSARDEDSGEYRDLLMFRGYFKDGLEEIVKKREELLKEKPCFLKPKHGACGNHIVHLSYEDGKVTLRTKTNYSNFISMHINPDLRKIVVDKDFEGFEVEEGIENLGGKRVYFQIDNRHFFAELDPFDEENNASAIFEDGIRRDTFSPLPAEYFANCNFKRIKDEDNYIYEIEVDNLSNFLYGLEAMMLDLDISTYMEQEINIPKIDGKTWEIRQVNISREFNNPPVPLANYVKMGGNDYLGGLSKGGHGKDSREIVFQAYKQIRPYDSDEHLTNLTNEYLKEIEFKAIQVSELLSEYMTEVCREKLPELPFDEVNCDHLSTDFMA